MLKKFSAHHPIWVVLNQLTSKGLMAIKFLIAASVLGPELMGVVGSALLIYAISESVSEFGFIHALIQSKDEPESNELDFVWWSLFFRGGALGGAIIIIGYLIPMIEHRDEFFISCCLIALCSLIKAMPSVGLYLAQRNRLFHKIFFLSAIAACFDLLVTLFFLLKYGSLLSIFLGLLVSELMKCTLSYFIFGYGFRKFYNPLNIIHKYVSYGKWIFGGNILNLLLNQSDKLITGAMLGVTQLGVYQMSGRLAQLGISDVAVAIGQYLFPSFSRLNGKDNNKRNELFSKAFTYMLVFSISSCICLYFVAELVPVLLGIEWNESVNILQLLAISMANGALISVLVAFHRSIGFPKRVTVASLIQLCVFIPSLILLTYFYGVIGTAISTILGTSTVLITLITQLGDIKIIMKNSILYFAKRILIFSFITLFLLNISNVWLTSLIAIICYFYMLFSIFYYERFKTDECIN